eukprot:1071769-Pelagomonas_calceolata.AAC.1
MDFCARCTSGALLGHRFQPRISDRNYMPNHGSCSVGLLMEVLPRCTRPDGWPPPARSPSAQLQRNYSIKGDPQQLDF